LRGEEGVLFLVFHGRPDTMAPRRVHILTAIALVGVGLVVLAGANLHLTLDSDQVSAWVQPRASAALNRPVTLGRAGVSLWPRPSVRLTDVSVGNLPDFDGPKLANVDAARLDVAWLPLIVGRVHVRRLVLIGADLHMAIDERGTSNFGDLVPRSGPLDPAPASLSLRIREIALLNSSITYFDAHGGRSLMVSGVEVEAALDPVDGGWQTTLAARSDSLLVRFAGLGQEIVRGAGPSAVLRARSGAERGAIEIDEGRLAFVKDTVAVYGSLALGGREPRFEVLFTDEDVSAGFLTELFPTASRSELLPVIEGKLGLMVQLHGGSGTPPALRGSLRLSDVSVRIRGEPMIDRVSGMLAVTPDTILVDSLAGRFAGGPFELSGTIARAAGVAAFVARGAPDLDAFDRLGLLPDGVTLSGDADLYLSVVGPSSSLDSIEVVGVATLMGLRLEHHRLGVPLYVPSGEISFVGREAHWADLTVLVGQDRVTTTGSIVDLFDALPLAERALRVEANVNAPRLDLDAALPPRDSTSRVTYAQLALAHLGGRSIDGQSAGAVARTLGLARPERLPAFGAFDLTADTLVFRSHVLEGVRARVELGDSALAVPEATFGTWGGSGRGSLELGIGPGTEEPFALVLALEDVDAAPFLSAMSPAGESVSGILDLLLEVHGSTDQGLLPHAEKLTGHVEMGIANGRVQGTGVNMALADFLGSDGWLDVGFDAWVMDMDLRDRVLDIGDARLSGAEGSVVFSGPLRLDGSTDLSMGLSIPPERLGDVSLRRTGIGQSVLAQLRAAGGSLDVGHRLRGGHTAPTLEPAAPTAGAPAR
jgi:hypothetical protein